MTNRSKATTHADDCWGWGPKHYECAVAEIERLREQLRLATVDQAIAEAEASDAHAENKRLRDAAPAAQTPRACTCHPDDRPDGPCRERYAASECQALAAQEQAERLREALKEIRSRSCMNLAMNPNPYALTALLGDIHQIADAALAKEDE